MFGGVEWGVPLTPQSATTARAHRAWWQQLRATHGWLEATHAEKTKATIDTLRTTLPKVGLIWGGDWNHALSGREYAGSHEGRTHVLNAVDKLRLKVPTAILAHRLPGLHSIDHIAVSLKADVTAAYRIVAGVAGKRLSDHDAYVVEVTFPGIVDTL